MLRRDRHLVLALAVVSVALGIAPSVIGLPADLLLALPSLLMLVPLLVGRYVGEERIARMRRTPAPPRRRASVVAVPPARCIGVMPPGGRLVAASLARRGPPAALLAR